MSGSEAFLPRNTRGLIVGNAAVGLPRGRASKAWGFAVVLLLLAVDVACLPLLPAHECSIEHTASD